MTLVTVNLLVAVTWDLDKVKPSGPVDLLPDGKPNLHFIAKERIMSAMNWMPGMEGVVVDALPDGAARGRD